MLKFQVAKRHPNYKRIKRRCLNCGVAFEVRPSDGKKFCSKACFNEFLGRVRSGNQNPNWKPKVIKRCEICGRKFQSYPSNTKRRFCSLRCWLEWLRNVRKISPDNRRKMLSSLMKRPTRPERKLMEIIRKNNLTLKYVGNGECIIGGLNPDFIDEKHKLIVEVFGRYWHSPQNSRKTQWETVRRAIFRKFGYKMCVIWEDEVDNERSVLQKLASAAFD
jgi:very-short-patch-repair endonuclease/ribosomal protein S14